MNSQTRQYVFGLIFIAFGGYQLYIPSYLDFTLYLCAGLAFIFNALTFEPRFLAFKKILVVITWSLIIATGLVFFYLVRYRFF